MVDVGWYAFSLWPLRGAEALDQDSMREEYRKTVSALWSVAGADKPFEPEFETGIASGGEGDLAYVLASLVAAKAAKAAGVRKMMLNVALDEGNGSWGLNDLAVARAALHAARDLEDGDFKVYLVASAGAASRALDPERPLDYERALSRLAAAAAIADDIEPHDSSSPNALFIAGPTQVEDSVRVARQALLDYRAARDRGEVADMSSDPLVLSRASKLLRGARRRRRTSRRPSRGLTAPRDSARLRPRATSADRPRDRL